MAHWFHRNPLKATAPVTYDLKGVATNGESQKICSDLRHTRAHLLEVLSNPNNEVSSLTGAVDAYICLLQGLIAGADEQQSGDSKLRHAVKYKWTNTLCGNVPQEQQDALFEAISIAFNVGLWYTKHSAKLAGQEEPTMEEAKEVHKCLRTAAGVFSHIKESLVSRLIEVPEKGTDTDTRVLQAYIHQCTAEAQEVTIARAIELKHSSSIISSLAYETARMFTDADNALTSCDEKSAGKWRKYLQFKMEIYYAYSYNYYGETILAQDKCGEAIKCLEESQKHLDTAQQLGKEYTITKGPGTTCKPHEHLFFRRLGPIIKRTLEKCVRENGFIYHQKVPAEAPALELKATYGLVAPEEFTLPPTSAKWTTSAYKAFDVSKCLNLDQKDKDKDQKDLPPVKESDIPQSNKDPGTFSGCVVS